jgi:YD repeat-containing protein
MSLPAQKFQCINPAPPASGGSSVAGNAISQANQLVQSMQAQASADIPGALVGPGYLNIAAGNLVVLLDHPTGGPFDPTPVLVYNSKSASGAASEYGFGWSELHKNRVKRITEPKADVTDGLGTIVHFSCKNPGNPTQIAGTYRPPGGCQSALVRNADSTWDQTLPDGLKLHYNSSGTLTYLADTANDRWTLSYDASQRISAINNPFGLRTTYSYASNKIRRVQDAFGRISTFTVDGNGNLVQRIAPDLGVTTLSYDTSSRLTEYRDPQGNRATFTYSGPPDFVTAIQRPTGTTNYNYRDWLTTKVTDAAQNVTTILHDIRRNVVGTINPLGKRATYLYTANYLQGMVDPNGNRTTFTYATLTNQTKRLASIQDAGGGRFTFGYDGSDRVNTITDQRSQQSNLTWSGSNRTGLQDALNNSSAYAYDSHGQLTAVVNPLGNRFSMVYDGSGNMVGRLNPLGNRTSYAFDGKNQIKTAIVRATRTIAGGTGSGV